MDAKKIFQPKIWYIICGAMALIGGIENNINAETWAKNRKRTHPRMNFYHHKRKGNRERAEYYWNKWFSMH